MKGYVKTIIAGAIILGIGIAVILIAGGTSNWQYVSGDAGDYEMKSYEAQTDVKNLSVDFSAGELKIVFGDTDKITVDYPENNRYTTKIEENGENLYLSTGRKHWYDFFGGITQFPETTVTLPENGGINLVFEMNAGKAQIESGSFSNLSLKLNAGKINIGDIECNNLTCHVNAGDFIVGGAKSSRAVLKVNAGELIVKDLDCPDVDAEVNAGAMKVTVDGIESDYTISTEVNAGSCNKSDRTGTTDKKIRAKANAGSLEINFTD